MRTIAKNLKILFSIWKSTKRSNDEACRDPDGSAHWMTLRSPRSGYCSANSIGIMSSSSRVVRISVHQVV